MAANSRAGYSAITKALEAAVAAGKAYGRAEGPEAATVYAKALAAAAVAVEGSGRAIDAEPLRDAEHALRAVGQGIAEARDDNVRRKVAAAFRRSKTLFGSCAPDRREVPENWIFVLEKLAAPGAKKLPASQRSVAASIGPHGISESVVCRALEHWRGLGYVERKALRRTRGGEDYLVRRH